MMKKRFDHMTREEYRRKKYGHNYSDEYDDEIDWDSYLDDSDLEMTGYVNRSRQKIKPENATESADENGKPLKRPAHISEKEWAKMNREEQMERMNKLAAGFNFYAMDNKNENLKYKMPEFKK